MRQMALILKLAPTLILTLALGGPAAAQDVLPAWFGVTGVAADDVLNIRERPDAGSAVIGTLAPDATGVEVVEISDGWAMVTTGERSGYAALRYLAPEPAPAWNSLQVPLTCLGTEPFWSLEIDPATSELRRRTPDRPEVETTPLTAAWPGSTLAPDMAVVVEDGIAVLSPKACSDGMSDRRYGIAIQIFRTGTGYIDRDLGCCMLGLR